VVASLDKKACSGSAVRLCCLFWVVAAQEAFRLRHDVPGQWHEAAAVAGKDGWATSYINRYVARVHSQPFKMGAEAFAVEKGVKGFQVWGLSLSPVL
jgi:hypothetical protein